MRRVLGVIWLLGVIAVPSTALAREGGEGRSLDGRDHGAGHVLVVDEPFPGWTAQHKLVAALQSGKLSPEAEAAIRGALLILHLKHGAAIHIPPPG